jgi:hypothetical protein
MTGELDGKVAVITDREDPADGLDKPRTSTTLRRSSDGTS